MDIGLLSKMVRELILKNDQVGLPGMGTFVAEMIPASFSDKGYTINPPYRRLSFFPAKLEEDLLVDFYAKSNGIDRAAAKSYIEHYIQDLKAVLLDRKTVVMPELGRLRATKDNTFFFVPNEDLDIFPEGFSLAPVSLKTHVETPEEIAISVTNLANIMEGAADVPAEPVAEEESTAEPLLIEPDEGGEEPIEPLPGVELPEPEPAPEPEPVPAPVPAPSKPKKKCRWWLPILIILGIAFILLALFLVLASVAPDFVDSILYTPEELRIINY